MRFQPVMRGLRVARILPILMVVPVALEAQTRTAITGYLAADPGVSGDPLLVGVSVARERGPLALRLGAAFDISAPPPDVSDPVGTPATPVTPVASGIWNTDLDAMLYLGNPGGRGALIPYGVAGVGTRGIQTDGRLGMALNYSYGGGFRSPLGAGFALEGEARYRESFAEFSEGELPFVDSGLELRVGISAGFGGAPRVVSPGVAPAPLPPRGSIASSATYGSAAASSRLIGAALSTAERYIGVPYRWGGNTPSSGFDCSGFIRYVFAQHGITVPRVSRDQARFGRAVPLDIRYFQPGDIIAFASDGRTVDHTAIYAGAGRIIHSSSSGRGVRYDDLYSSRGTWYLNHMVAVRRIVADGVMLGG